MIVICTKCQAKFRVADEKIGPRGARVRCSRCRTVFHVHCDVGVVPSPGASDAAERSAWPTAPRAEAPRVAPSPPPLPPPLPAAPPPSDDPFAFPAAAPDPFAGADPFALAARARSGAPLAATDLSDLLGGAPDPFAASALSPPPEPPAAPKPPDDGGLALEERLTPPPLKVARLPEPEPPLEVAGPQSFEVGGDRAGGVGPQFEPAAFYGGEAGGEPLALAVPSAPPRERPEEPPRRAAPPGVAPPVRAAPAPPIAAERLSRRRTSRVRAVVVNALALAALLLVALGMLALWRGQGSIDLAALRPAALLEATRGDVAASGPFATSDVRSGLYERARGAPLLFVRGTVRSRSSRPVASVRVSVAVVRAGEVLARGDAIAGAIPTPEELHAAIDGEALARAIAAARARAPSEVKPGDAVPFLVAIGDAPGDLEGAAIRIEAAPVGSRSR